MAETIERLYKLTVDGTQAQRSLNEIAKSADAVDKRFEASVNSVKKFGTALAAAVSVGAIVGGIKQVIDSFDQLGKDAQKVGIAAEDLQRLRFAADMSGVGAEKLDTAIGKLAVNMSHLGEGGNKAADALHKIGVNAGDTSGEALGKIADQFAKMPDGIQKTALAIELFGKAGADMIPLLNGGSEALAEMTKEADKFGGVVSQGAIDGAQAFNDNLSRLERTAAGAGAQLVTGLLPALQTLSQSLVDSASTGDGFVSTGEKIGEMLLTLYGFALKAGATLQAFGMTIGAVMAAASNPGNARTIFGMLVDDINALEKATNQKLAKTAADFKKFNDEVNKSSADAAAAAKARNDAAAAANRLAEAEKRRAEAAKEHRKAEEDWWKEQIRMQGELDKAQKVSDDALTERNSKLTSYQKAIMDVDAASKQRLDTIEEEGARLKYLMDLLDETSDVYATGTEAQRSYARAQLEVANTTGKSSQVIEKQKTALDLAADGFNEFFQTLASGTADAEDAFKRMTQSILAQLLRLLAKKAIFSAFGIDIGGAGSTTWATGGVFDSGKAVPFARGGVISSPSMFPMALAGEAGPEAIVPLRRTASGDLGIQAQQQPLNITINNNAPNVQVEARQSPDGLEVIISQVKASLTADVLRGGNDFAHANERAYGLTRGSAAAF